MTPVKGKRGKHVHLTLDLRQSLCGIKVDGFVVQPDERATCQRCRDASEFN